MRIVKLQIQNFRSIQQAELLLPANVVLVGDNNSGKYPANISPPEWPVSVIMKASE